ncbi:hypothetical protein [Pseudooceanicola sp.]|nr:hypothetical protein [Pseudooceanicola sp.]MDF1854123.1 hypothetical protein [Pseudooceanicola sp.]
MLDQIITVAKRARGTLIQDAIGAASLMLMLVGALYLPGFA